MKSKRVISSKLLDLVVVCSAACLLLLVAGATAAQSKEAIPADLLQRWNKLRAESPDTGQVADLLNEGERIITRLQELEDLRRDPEKASSKNYYQRVVRLQDRFKDLLRRIEMARLSTLPQEEIMAMRSRYEDERRRLEDEIVALEDSIIIRGEKFLNTYKQQIALKHYMSKQEMIVDFIYRLAEIYYRRGEDEFYRNNDITAFKPSLEKYQRIIDEFPASEYVDDALYNIAYVKNSSQSLDDRLEAITLYKTLIAKYHDSPFVPEAYWRVAEFHFYQTPPNVAEAITYYAQLQNYPDTNWYVRGLYKVGWCHFLAGDYPAAIDYFTQTVEASLDSSRVSGDLLFASMLDEALEYISVCFAQDREEWAGSGVAAALAFVKSDSLRQATYGKRILEYLGDIYQYQVGKYDLAIEAFTAYLDLYPLDAKAPWLQEKIIKCYAANLRDFQSAYEEKDRLFTLYRTGTAWDEANPDPQLRADANKIIEEYYFQNINESIGRALKNNDQALVARSVEMSQNYLDEYPEGPNAYTVNYNMAVLLDQHVAKPDQAYVEYIKVSKDYPDDRHRKDAAVSAVVIAQRMVADLGKMPADSLRGTEIGDAEQKLIDAVDNYLAYFPDGEEADVFLMNAGAVYYNHGMYEEARQYYRRLVTDFPLGLRRAAAYRYIMNSYFAEGNFVEAEKVAKEIQSVGVDPELLADARTRQAEATFLHAQGLKDEGDLLAAADEYRRSALETPDYENADKALFEAGLAYQEAKAWEQANEVYLLLVERYPESELADKSLYNAGYNSQSELGDKQFAAATFERLAMEYPQSELAQDALRNASINYVEAQDWNGAIRVNSSYVQMFPGAPDANVFLFESAGLYLKLGNEAAANEVYATYAQRFPNDPRTVRAYWEHGKYLQEQGRHTEAIAEFNSGIQAHRDLVAQGQRGEETYASRCLYEVIKADFAAYEAIEFAPASAVETKKAEKLAKRDQLLNLLAELNGFAKDEMLEGLYMVGRVEEELSRCFASQALPEKGSAEEKIITREIANQDAIEIARRAMDAYVKAAQDIEAAARVLSTKEEELERHKQELSLWVLEAQKSDSIPPGLPDSSVALSELDRGLEDVRSAFQIATDWSRRAQEKVPELALRNAEIKFATVQAFLDLPDVGKNDELKMLYRSGVLSEFAAPRSAVVIGLYREAIAKSGYSDDEEQWKAKALNNLAQVFEALESEYRELNERALDSYSRFRTIYQDLLSQGEGATTSGGLEAADIAEKLVLYSDHSYEFALGALEAQNTLLDSAEGGDEIPLDIRSRFVAAAIEEAFRINERYAILAAEALDSKSVAEQRQGESVVWEDAVLTYEDCAYNFNGHREELLSTAMNFNRLHGNDQALALRIGWMLVDLDRETYLSLLADYGTEAWIWSDETFVVSPSFESGWEKIDFADDGWSAPRVTAPQNLGRELAESQALWIALEADTLVCDSLYLRKAFAINGEPVAGDLWISVDGGYALQVNEEFIGATEPGEGWTEVAHYDVSQTLRSGSNVIAVMAVDPDSTTQGVALALKYKVLPAKPTGEP